MLQRAGVPTASAELLLSRMRAKVGDLCRERDTLRKAASACRDRRHRASRSQLPALPTPARLMTRG